MRGCWLSLVAVAVLGAARAQAQFIAYDNAAAVTGLQNYGNNLGLDFDVAAPGIVVTALGAFDNGLTTNLDGVANGGIDVGIFDRNTTNLVVGSSTVHFSSTITGTQINGDAFLPVNFTLPAGNYSVVAFNDGNFNSNATPNASSTTNNGAGLISFVGGGRYAGASSLGYAFTPDGGPANRYDAGTFQFSPVPEPASLVLSALGALGLLIARGQRRAKVLAR